MNKLSQCMAALAFFVAANPAFAHSVDHHGQHTPTSEHAASEQQPWGIAGAPDAATRTIELRMGDNMRFTPSHFNVKLGETVRLRVENAGQILHEIVLGTPDTLDAHAQDMLQHPGMAHAEAFMAHVSPQDTGTLTWTFNRPGTFDFACLIAGHFQNGMRGSFTVAP